MLDLRGVLIILMPRKLVQADQNAMINHITTEKIMALTGENDQKPVQVDSATQP